MSAPRVWIVTPVRGGAPYRVTLHEDDTHWRAGVERDGTTWSYVIRRGPAEGLGWIEDRPLRWRWDATSGRLVLRGESHAFEVETETAHQLAVLGGTGRAAIRVEEVRAPMPGLVVAVEVAEGQEVTTGQGLFVIEAMKMENEIPAPAAGVVRDVRVRSGEAVEGGAPLCRIAPLAEPSA